MRQRERERNWVRKENGKFHYFEACCVWGTISFRIPSGWWKILLIAKWNEALKSPNSTPICRSTRNWFPPFLSLFLWKKSISERKCKKLNAKATVTNEWKRKELFLLLYMKDNFHDYCLFNWYQWFSTWLIFLKNAKKKMKKWNDITSQHKE